MTTRMTKWRYSLSLLIRGIGRKTGTYMFVKVLHKNGKLIVTPLVESAPTLEQILMHVNQQNLYCEVDMGMTVGKEVL